MNTDKLNITEKTTDGETRAIETSHIEIIAEIKDALIRTGNTGTADPAIPDGINKLGKITKAIKAACLDISDSDGFYYYSANKNVEGVLGKMLERFLNPEKSGDISKTAEDSLAVLPAIKAVFDSTQSRQMDDAACHHVLDKTGELNRVADDRNLRPRPGSVDPKFIAELQKNGTFDAMLKRVIES